MARTARGAARRWLGICAALGAVLLVVPAHAGAVSLAGDPHVKAWLPQRPLHGVRLNVVSARLATRTVGGGVRLRAGDRRIRLLGAHPERMAGSANRRYLVSGNVTPWHEHPPWSAIFRTRARSVAILSRGDIMQYRLRVNGRVTPVLHLPSGHSGAAVVLRFRSRAARTIQFEMGDPMPAFGGVVVPRGERVWRPRLRYGPKVIVLGDSRAGGLGALASFTGLVQRAALRLGWLNVWASGTDGTGYTTSPTSGRLAFAARLQHDVIAQRPDVVVVTGGNNDDDPSAVEPAAAELYRRIRAGLPRAKLVVVSNFPSHTPDALAIAKRDAIRTAAASVGAPFIDAISDPWISDATAPLYTGADGDHPTQAGHDHLGDELARALKRVLRLR